MLLEVRAVSLDAAIDQVEVLAGPFDSAGKTLPPRYRALEANLPARL
jgi:hypothetical protein